MSSFQDAGWLRRLWSLARPGDPATAFVQNVALMQDARFQSSRERAPYAAHAGFIAGAGAGVHNFVEIGGTDPLGPVMNLLHDAAVELSMGNSLTGLLRVALADGAALTTATRVATTPMFRDADPDVTPVLFVGTIATANIPATNTIFPRAEGIGQTNATPLYSTSYTPIPPLQGLPFARSWLGPRNLILFGGDDEVMVWRACWQAVRA